MIRRTFPLAATRLLTRIPDRLRTRRPIGFAAGVSLALVAGIVVSACSLPAPSPPAAEFLVATRDSTFWVRSTAAGVSVIGVPMTLTQYDGRFRELYVADVDRSFSDAIFTGERIYTRDLETGDSSIVYDDTLVVHLADRYARANPGARPLAPDDDTPDDADVVAQGETDMIEVRGPFLLLEHRSSFEHPGGEQYDTVRTAIDLRTLHGVRPVDVMHDSTVHDSTSISHLPHTWHRAGYELVARGDSANDAISLLLRDRLQRAWPLMTVARHARVYWLDTPALSARLRTSLMRAFNAAAGYGDDVTYVRRVILSPSCSRFEHRS